ncbi:unnamed protein product [Dovyalis caffra]|uniref:Uncharacterized protein n=1 Tax=Dovyalis caffra TaxID=77055 RepID=A0AAV1S0E2_9ROSI|nr:unnamed protein product [Dovyalis caffra]
MHLFAKSDPIIAALIDTFALPTLLDSPTQVGPLAFIDNFIFSSARTDFLKGLAKCVSGLAALGRSKISIPVQFHEAFSSSPHCFSLCLSAGSKSKPGVAFFGSKGPYIFLPGSIDLSKSLLYTPLLLNPVVALNQALLAIDGENGSGGTKISTVVPYIKLETSIYEAFIGAFLKEASSAFHLYCYDKAF